MGERVIEKNVIDDLYIDNIVKGIILKLIETRITMHHSVEEWEKVLRINGEDKTKII